MKTILNILLLSLFVVTPAVAERVNIKVPANKTTVLGNFGTYNELNCSHGPIPKPKLTKAPSHGKVTFKRSTRAVSKGRCKGDKIKSTMMIYTPKRGYRGKDVFKIQYSYDKYTTATMDKVYVNHTLNLVVK